MLTACAPRDAAFTVAHRTAIVDSIQTMLTQWHDALNAKELARAAAFYSTSPDFRWYQDGELAYGSGQEFRDTLRAMGPKIRAISISLIEPRITALAPGVGVVTSGFAETLTDTTGALTGFAGALTMTVVHGDSGWQFLVGHHSSVIPPRDSMPRSKGAHRS